VVGSRLIGRLGVIHQEAEMLSGSVPLNPRGAPGQSLPCTGGRCSTNVDQHQPEICTLYDEGLAHQISQHLSDTYSVSISYRTLKRRFKIGVLISGSLLTLRTKSRPGLVSSRSKCFPRRAKSESTPCMCTKKAVTIHITCICPPKSISG